MRTERDVEAYLGASGRSYEPVADQPGLYLVEGPLEITTVLKVDDPLVVARVHIGDVPAQADHLAIFRRLLETNVQKLVHTSFGLDGNRILLSAARELETLDRNELEAILDEIDLALSQDVPALRALCSVPAAESPESPATSSQS